MWATRVPEEKCCNQSDLINFGKKIDPWKNYLALDGGEKMEYITTDGLDISRNNIYP